MRILIVEDDAIQADWIEEVLRRNLADLTVWTLRDEHAFRLALPSLREEPPDILIMDLMLRWAQPTRDFPQAPAEVREGSPYRGGLRCLALLLEFPETAEIPVVMYSSLERGDVSFELQSTPKHVFYLSKDSDGASLVGLLRSLRAALGTAPAHASSWRSRLWQSIEIKPGWLGLGVDLKRFLRRRPPPKG